MQSNVLFLTFFPLPPRKKFIHIPKNCGWLCAWELDGTRLINEMNQYQ